MTVLILTCREDITADMVVDRLAAMGRPVLRLDPADLPGSIDITTVYDGGTVRGEISHAGRTVDLAELTGVWIRRPGRPGESVQVQRDWVGREADHALYGALRALEGLRWMNPLDAVSAARYKAVQLGMAHAVGFRAPATLITTSPADAAGFVEHHATVCKSVSGRQPDGLEFPTTTVGPDADFSGVAAAPTCLQQRIEKTADIRLTVVGEEMFAARTTSPALDWRFEQQQAWAPIEVPDVTRARVEQFMTSMGLVYGAFDFAEDATGEWHFLEVNPLGQFGFIEFATGQPISLAIAEWLATPARVPVS